MAPWYPATPTRIPRPLAQSEGIVSEGQGHALASLPARGGQSCGSSTAAAVQHPLRAEPAPLFCGRESVHKTKPEGTEGRGGPWR